MKHRINGKKAASFVLRAFKCQGCGLKMVAPKSHGSEPGHIKDMYCPNCKAETKFEMFDSDRIFHT
jgi:rubredoxin